MDSTARYNAKSDDGTDLDSEFEVEVGSFDVVLLSRNGKGRNPQYYEGLDSILGRLATSGSVLAEIWLDSEPARKQPLSDRVIPIGCPRRLDPDTDIEALRKEITSAQVGVCQKADAKGGNSHRRIRLRVEVPGANSQKDLLSILGH